MNEERGNLILLIILAILLIIAIIIGIVNPNKVEKTVETYKEIEEASSKNEDNKDKNEQQNSNKQKYNENQEKKLSMQTGGILCKIGNQIIYYEASNKSIYLYNIENSQGNKLATIGYTLNKMYFDGENVYLLPDYNSMKKIYKMDLQGNVKEIHNGASLQLWITDEKIYFVNQVGFDDYNKNPQGTICVMNKDGSNVVQLAKSIKNYFYILNDKIYYTTQDRKMYTVNIDGTNQTTITEGRKFITYMSEKYLLYVDYANQEEQHILNLETKVDQIVGYYAKIDEYNGETYIKVRRRLDDGSIEQEFTLLKIEDSGTVLEIENSIEMQNKLDEIHNKYSYILGTNAYKVDNSDVNNIKIEQINI